MFALLENIDRRIIFLFVALSLSVPIFMEVNLKPAKMEAAKAFFNQVELLEDNGKIVLVSLDWGPSTMAENRPQSMVAMEHLMRNRIPFALISVTPIATPFLEELPRLVKEKLELEQPDQKWVYGEDWVNFGFRPGGLLMIQNLAKTQDMIEHIKTDARSNPLRNISMMEGVKSIDDIQMLMEFTGSVGIFNVWLQFFSGPVYLHGCTSITIPEAVNYFATSQILGLFEGVAGAAYYESLLTEHFSTRAEGGEASSINSGLSFAQLGIFGFIFLGNLGLLIRTLKSRSDR